MSLYVYYLYRVWFWLFRGSEIIRDSNWLDSNTTVQIFGFIYRETTGEEAEETMTNIASRAHRSASTDILGSSKKDSPTEKKSHFNTLKAWGMSRLKLISPKSSQQSEQQETSASGTERSEQDQGQSRTAEETNIYEMVITRRRKDKSHERKPSSSSSSGKSTSSIPVSVPSTDRQPSVKLRESAAQRRERRKGSNRDEPPHSSSGNWSASSESGRASIGSETTTTTHQPRYGCCSFRDYDAS